LLVEQVRVARNDFSTGAGLSRDDHGLTHWGPVS
jgi:hypothetical protein